MAKSRLDDPLTAAQLRARLDYIPSTGAFIWRYQPTARKEWNSRYAGTRAGTLHSEGYRQIQLYGRFYFAHRLAFLWMTGKWPPVWVDHRDTDRSNDAWTNLRPATYSQNARNSQLRSSNTSGFKGAYWDKHKGYWGAAIRANGPTRFLGYYDTAEKAAAAYIKAAKRLYGEFAR